jgi:hypothetical protein
MEFETSRENIWVHLLIFNIKGRSLSQQPMKRDMALYQVKTLTVWWVGQYSPKQYGEIIFD